MGGAALIVDLLGMGSLGFLLAKLKEVRGKVESGLI